jgi:hypothetical protein
MAIDALPLDRNHAMTRHLRLLPLLAAFGCGGANPTPTPPPPGAAFLRARGTEIWPGSSRSSWWAGWSA